MLIGVAILGALALPLMATPVGFQSDTPVLSGGTVANFEGFTEFTSITTQYSGMTFSQAGGGAPMIDNYGESSADLACSGDAWCYGYGASSGSGVLTASVNGTDYPSVADIIVSFTDPQSDVQAFLSDTDPEGNYTITAYSGTGASGSVLGTITVLEGDVLPPGYSGGDFPTPGTTPLPGIWVGFIDSSDEIGSLVIGPSSNPYDAFAIDDVSDGGTTPEPATFLLIGVSLLGMVAARRRKLSR